MACTKREKTGHCGHWQCMFPQTSGYECVEVTNGLCEVAGTCAVVACRFNVPYKQHVNVSQWISVGECNWIATYRTFEDALNNHDPFVHVDGSVHTPIFRRREMGWRII